MRNFVNVLMSKAFKEIPGEDYNQVSWDLRQARAEKGLVFYEVVMDEDPSWEELRDRVYPAFSRYLGAKSMNPASGAGAVVSLFIKGRCSLLEGPEFFKAFKEIEHLDAAGLRGRVRQWLCAVDRTRQALLPAGRPGVKQGE